VPLGLLNNVVLEKRVVTCITVNMAEAYHVLAAEIDKVVNCPYPSQLKASHHRVEQQNDGLILHQSLRDILWSRCSSVDINRCIQAMPCKVDQLVSRLLEGLPQWPYVLDIVTMLGKNLRW